MPTANWVVNAPYLDWQYSNSNTNTSFLTDPTVSLMATYVKSFGVYKCPGDLNSAQNGERVRSVSMNGSLGYGFSGPDVLGNYPNPPAPVYFGKSSGGTGVGHAAYKINDLGRPGPVNVFVFLDEHGDSINDGVYMFDPGASRTDEQWRDLPASYHNGAGSFSFADGHSEIHKWLQHGGQTIFPIMKQNWTSGAPWTTESPTPSHFSDYEWVESHMPYQ
jgi:prepilin-type processing-associated H-X9-DG protein